MTVCQDKSRPSKKYIYEVYISTVFEVADENVACSSVVGSTSSLRCPNLYWSTEYLTLVLDVL